jgi:hypothetical protein
MQYVACQLDLLRDMGSVAQVRESHNSLPIGLDATYERILLSLKSQVGCDLQAITSMLKWLCAWNEPLYLGHLANVYTYTSRFWPPRTVGSSHGNIVDELKAHSLLDVRSILKHLRSMVTVVKIGYYIVDLASGTSIPWYQARLAHFSVKEYLASSRAPPEFCFSEAEACTHVAHQALSWLELIACSVPPNTSVRGSIEYMNRWSSCLEKVPWPLWPAELKECVRRTFAPGSATLVRITEWHPKAEYLDKMFARGPCSHGLLLAASLNLPNVVDALISSNDYAKEEDLSLAVLGAAYNGNPKLVDMLLDRGARATTDALVMTQVNKWRWGTRWRPDDRLEVIKLLVSRGASVNYESSFLTNTRFLRLVPAIESGPSPLALAAKNFDVNVCAYLVSQGATCLDDACAVAEAAKMGRKIEALRVLELLLQECKTSCKHPLALHAACEGFAGQSSRGVALVNELIQKDW